MDLLGRITRRTALLAAAAFAFASNAAMAETKIPFTLDWKFEGPSAPYFAAIDNGHFSAAGLDVEIRPEKDHWMRYPKSQLGLFRLVLLT